MRDLEELFKSQMVKRLIIYWLNLACFKNLTKFTGYETLSLAFFKGIKYAQDLPFPKWFRIE